MHRSFRFSTVSLLVLTALVAISIVAIQNAGPGAVAAIQWIIVIAFVANLRLVFVGAGSRVGNIGAVGRCCRSKV